MSEFPFSDFKVLAFDVYGTLADYDTGVFTALQPLLSRYSASADWSSSEALTAFAGVVNDLLGRHGALSYPDLLAKAHEIFEERLKEASGSSTESTSLESDPGTLSSTSLQTVLSSSRIPETAMPNEHIAFSHSIANWPVFNDTPEALRRLAKRYKLVILSNVDRDSFAYTHMKLAEGNYPESPTALYACPDPNPHQYWHPHDVEGTNSPFTLIVTAQDVQSYKPALWGFIKTLEAVQAEPDLLDAPDGNDAKDKVLWVACSIYHDVEPAASLGVKSVWIDRLNEHDGRQGAWTWRFTDLAQLADAVEKDFTQA